MQGRQDSHGNQGGQDSFGRRNCEVGKVVKVVKVS